MNLCKLLHKRLSSLTTTNSCSVKNSSSGIMSFSLLLCTWVFIVNLISALSEETQLMVL